MNTPGIADYSVHEPAQPQSPPADPDTPTPESAWRTRDPLDPITRPLWRYKQAERRRILEPFVDRQVRLDRWFSRVASGGDRQYVGTLIAVAISTIGTAADLLILRTPSGTTWAISAAQVAFLELAPAARRPKVAGKRPTTPEEMDDA